MGIKSIIKNVAEYVEIEAKERAERELERRGLLDGAPSRCGQCRFAKWSPKHMTHHCSHRGGPDSFGNIGFVVVEEAPPEWCPRLNGLWKGLITIPRGWAKISSANETHRAREAIRKGATE